MSTTNGTAVDLRALQDRIDITDALYRYSSAIDSFDLDGVRSLLADDVWAQYGNLDPVEGGDAVVEWIGGATSTIVWQHHLLSVYHVDVDGDTATALSYLTSYQEFTHEPNVAKTLVARYHDELARTPDGWKITRRVAEFLWGESRAVDEEWLSALGGRKNVWPNPAISGV
jgi:ketosteroid isomerase-like protein